MARHNLWPTPRAAANENRQTKPTPSQLAGTHGRSLGAAVNTPSMWPTPTVQDAANNGGPSQMRRNTKPLNAEVGGKLNPEWVEWLMNWPPGWTDPTRSCFASFADWQQHQHDWFEEDPAVDGLHRTAVGVENRTARLKAIGNGQVPAVARLAWETLTSHARADRVGT